MSNRKPFLLLPMLALAALAQAAEIDPDAPMELERAFQAIHRLRYEPYAGVQRGAVGTARSGGGNAADRALLLGRLLKASGHEVRYAHGRLSEPDLERLLGSLTPEGFQPPALQGQHKLSDPAADPALQRLARDHVWLEARKDGGDWVALDPTFPGAEAGRAYGQKPRYAAEPTTAPQRLRLQLKRRTTGGQVQTLGRAQTDVAALGLAPVSLVIRAVPQREAPRSDSSSGGPMGGISGGFSGGVSGGAPSPEPNLPAGEMPIIGTELEYTLSVPGAEPATVTRLVLLAKPETQSAREWLELTLEAPGQKPRLIERSLYEAADGSAPPAFRRYAIAVVAGALPRGAFEAELERARKELKLDEWDAALRKLLEAGPSDESLEPARAVEEASGRLVGQLLALRFAAESDAVTARLAATAGVAVVHAVPRILVSSVEARIDAAGAVQVQAGLDLRLDEVQAVPYKGMPAATARLFQLARGLQESTLEGAVLRGAMPDSRPVYTTAGLMEQAKAQGKTLLVLTAQTREALQQAQGLPASEAARIETALADGRHVLLPGAAVELDGQPRWGWWELDPASGALVGVLAGGGHQAMIDYDTIISKISARSDTGYVFGMLVGSAGMHVLMAAKILAKSELTLEDLAEIAAVITRNACLACAISGGVGIGKSDCYTIGEISTGLLPGLDGYAGSLCHSYVSGVKCAAAMVINSYGGSAPLSGDVAFNIPFVCD